MIQFTIPLVPPSVNHYVKHSGGRHFKTQETLAFERGIDVLSAGQRVFGKRFSVHIDVYLGRKQGRDIDNLPKCVLDGLSRNRVFRDSDNEPLSDNHIDHLVVRKFRNDRSNPRTVITVEAM